MGGEKIFGLLVLLALLGSPPRGRGKGTTPNAVLKQAGITPAWAGKSFVICQLVPLEGDHPRVGGEKLQQGPPAASGQGSPPRGRGKALPFQGFQCNHRITPAWAGKRRKGPLPQPLSGDHPRVGGEKSQHSSMVLGVGGSPPRGRGKEPRVFCKMLGEGITPAWAGKRQMLELETMSSEDHPRVGGEKTKKIP